MPDTTAKIRSKGLDATGVTEELAEKLFAHKGKHLMAIVELKVDEIHDKTDGKQRVDLVITQVEPADDSTTEGKMLEDHLRELTRTTYYNRKVAGGKDGQLALPDADGPDPKIGDVIDRGNALRLTEEQLADLAEQEAAADEAEAEDDDGPAYDDEDERDVDDVDLPDEQPSNVVQFGFGAQADADPGQRDDPITDPHTYVDTTNSLCAMCDQPAGHPLHQAVSA
jgi:hypothetical protein